MTEYQCKKCDITVVLREQTLIIVNGKVCTKESECKQCGKYMVEVEKDFTGFPTVIRNE
jgi:hypothetical protein